MLRFSQVIPTLIRVCQTHPSFASLESVAIVRDLRGLVRLFIKPTDGTLDFSSLEQALKTELGAYFVAPLWLTSMQGENGRLAARMLDLAERLPPVEYEDPVTGTKYSSQPNRWYHLERRLSKQDWLASSQTAPPWPLSPGKPAIVTFYSFKGGVGRTTAVVSCAWQLAQKGKRIVILDLDLEAPGAGALLGVQTQRGVLDFIIDYLATGQPDLGDLFGPAEALAAEADHVDVIPAGNLDDEYLEKLARLDFLSRDLASDGKPTESPVARALHVLLDEISTRIRPDYIFIDARAGLHDLAGLSLHGLSHVDTLFVRANEQGYQGLELTVRKLGEHKRQELLAVVVHALAPMDRESPETLRIEAEIRGRSFRIFNNHVLRPPVQENDTGASHYPWSIAFSPGLLHFTSITGKRDELFSRDYRDLCSHIEELCQPSEVEA